MDINQILNNLRGNLDTIKMKGEMGLRLGIEVCPFLVTIMEDKSPTNKVSELYGVVVDFNVHESPCRCECSRVHKPTQFLRFLIFVVVKTKAR